MEKKRTLLLTKYTFYYRPSLIVSGLSSTFKHVYWQYGRRWVTSVYDLTIAKRVLDPVQYRVNTGPNKTLRFADFIYCPSQLSKLCLLTCRFLFHSQEKPLGCHKSISSEFLFKESKNNYYVYKHKTSCLKTDCSGTLSLLKSANVSEERECYFRRINWC